MNTLSLFNGLGGLSLACDKAGIKVENCYYSEIDKYANQVMQKNYPYAIALGDITKWREWDIDWSSIDLVGAGFPCQAWSMAGKQLGDKDERGMLFWTTLDVISQALKHNPNAKFLMENVKMKKEFEDYITHHTEQALGHVEKILINSALVSAQNRNRFYWTNFEVEQPEDKGILLRDILESGHREPKVLINESATKHNKSYALTSSYNGAVAWNSCERKQRTMVPVCKSDNTEPNIYNGVLYRKLTPLECERLQTIPDNYTDCVSKTQRYKMIGNGWTIDAIAHILKFL